MKAIIKLRIKHDGNEYEPSAEAQEVKDLTKSEAAGLAAAGVIELPAKEAPKDPPKPAKAAESAQTDGQKADANADGKPAEGGQ